MPILEVNKLGTQMRSVFSRVSAYNTVLYNQSAFTIVFEERLRHHLVRVNSFGLHGSERTFMTTLLGERLR